MKKIFSFKKNRRFTPVECHSCGNFAERNYSTGFTMLEMIIAIFILVTAIIGSYSVFSRIMVSTSIISSKLIASYLAQEGIEITRNIRDTNWLKGLSWDNSLTNCSSGCDCSSGCEADYKSTALIASAPNHFLNIDADGFYGYSKGSTTTKFERKITVMSPTADVLQVSVSVDWSDRGQFYNFTVDESLYNWH